MYTSANVSFIIPNSNGEALLRKHLQSVLSSAGSAEIIIVDDASEDESVAFIRNNFPKIKLIQKKQQEGFSSTVNKGVENASREIIVLLNTDIVPDKDFLKYLLPHFENARVFAVGCLEHSMEKDGVVLRGRGEAMWKKGLYIHSRGETNKSTTAWVSGGSGAFRLNLWRRLGGMDEIFNPFYWEDIDLSYRALKAGYNLIFEPKSIIRHYHEAGAIRTQFTKTYVKQIAYRNQFLFIWKNISHNRILLEHVFWTSILIIKSLIKGDRDLLTGFYFALLRLPQVLKSRKVQRVYWKLSDLEIQLH